MNFVNYLDLYKVHILILTIWFGLQVFYFFDIYFKMKNNNSLSMISNKLGQGLFLARTFAGIINYNFACLFLFMNKVIVYNISNLSPLLPSNFHIQFHILIVSFIFIASAIHTVAHIYNFIILDTWFSIQGITGYLLIICFIIIIFTSYKSFRRKFYNIFINTHTLYLIIIVLTILHGSFCFVKTNENKCTEANFWKFIIGPLFLFLVERICREYYSTGVKFVSITKYAKDISKLDFYKDNFEFKEGQWVMINCPSISKTEWHPFTITSNPIEFGHVQVFIKESGDWTNKVVKLLIGSESESECKFKISYPYGNKYDIIKRYSVVVLVAGGIGITAFMSVIKSLPCYLGHGNKYTKLKKVYLYWTCRSDQDFNCFIQELQKIKLELNELFQINFYLTLPNNIRLYPPFEFNNSRPNFDEIFLDLEQKHPNTNIKILFCGPSSLNKALVKKCITMKSKSKTKFIFTQGETFF